MFTSVVIALRLSYPGLWPRVQSCLSLAANMESKSRQPEQQQRYGIVRPVTAVQPADFYGNRERREKYFYVPVCRYRV